jgi:hypothetical protein
MTSLLSTLESALSLMPHDVAVGTRASVLLQLLLLKAHSDIWQHQVTQAEKAGTPLCAFNANQTQRKQLLMNDACLYDNCLSAPPEETGKAIRDALLAFVTCQAHGELHGVFQPEQFLRLDSLLSQHGKTTHLADMVRALGELSFADILPSPDLGEVIAQAFITLGLGPDPAQCEAAQLMVQLLKLKNGQRLFDPACSQGMLLYAAASHMARFAPAEAVGLCGMTANRNDFTVASILFILCGQPQARLHLRDCLDVMAQQSPQSDLVQADRVLTIIPDAAIAWNHALALRDADPRFPVRPPADSRVAQFWIALASVNRSGRMAASIPAHLFESVDGNALRAYLLKHNLLEAVIAWPAPATEASPVMKGRNLVLLNRQNPHAGSAWIGPGLGNPANDSGVPYDANNVLLAYGAWLQQKRNPHLLAGS